MISASGKIIRHLSQQSKLNLTARQLLQCGSRLGGAITTRRLSSDKKNQSISPSFSSTEQLEDMDIDQLRRRQDHSLQEIQPQLFEEASRMTRSLYRLCLRSVRIIRSGNENDEKEFQEREKKRLRPRTDDDDDHRLLGVMSMLPPVNREDELRSRAEYYTVYTRENFVQEMDCLPVSELWSVHNVERFLGYIRKGNDDRKWLLQDMKFEDLYADSFTLDAVDQFEQRAMQYAEENERIERRIQRLNSIAIGEVIFDDEDDDDEDYIDSDDDEEEFPPWFREKYPHIPGVK